MSAPIMYGMPAPPALVRATKTSTSASRFGMLVSLIPVGSGKKIEVLWGMGFGLATHRP